jgi:uncharacterized protein (TIGR00159 family)
MSELGIRFSLFFARDTNTVLSDCIDVLLVAVVLYLLLLVLKGTRTTRIGFSIALLFGVYQFSKRLDLMTLHATLSTLLSPLLLLVIVVFQHDVRRGLQRLSRSPFFASGRVVLEHRLVEDAIRAACSLAAKRIGALLVFERKCALDPFVQSGTILNAAVTSELLYSVFIPSHENPLHDGAVIIRGGSIWRAGSFLPLSTSTTLDRNLGTRHRAALGISEETDAVVIVISEERGEISLCVDGILARNLDVPLLRRILASLFNERRHTKEVASRRLKLIAPRKSTPPREPPESNSEVT